MSAPTLTYDQLLKLRPCKDRLAVAERKIGGPREWNGKKVAASQARDLGMSFDDLVWAASALARSDKDVQRRLRLWMADCAARVLHIYEKSERSDAPRNAVTAARQYARGEIDEAAWSAAWAAASSAASSAAGSDAWSAARAAAGSAAWSAARAAAWSAAREAAGSAAWSAEREWQFNRLVEWFSDNEPSDWPLPEAALKAKVA